MTSIAYYDIIAHKDPLYLENPEPKTLKPQTRVSRLFGVSVCMALYYRILSREPEVLG